MRVGRVVVVVEKEEEEEEEPPAQSGRGQGGRESKREVQEGL